MTKERPKSKPNPWVMSRIALLERLLSQTKAHH